VVSQLAGWLALQELGSGESVASQLVLKVARELVQFSREDIEGQNPTPAATAHHAALRRAVALLEESFPAPVAEQGRVRAAWLQLEEASRLLPGFAMTATTTMPSPRKPAATIH
jgi:hypothetical protein